MDASLKHCFSPARLNGLTLKNRLIKAATFEGMTSHGVLSLELTHFHQRILRGGSAMTTLAYCAPEADGRLHADMLYIDEHIELALQSFTAACHREDGLVCAQLSHCGGFSKNRQLQRKRPLAPSSGLNPLGLSHGMFFCDAMTQQDIHALTNRYAQAAQRLKAAGFDALEIHLGHSYGLCQFLSPHTNKRSDRYGGSLQNRLRLPLDVISSVRNVVGDDFPLLAKISIREGYAAGISLEDTLEMVPQLEAAGIDAIVCSNGSSSRNPMLIFHGDNPLKSMLSAETHMPTRWLLKLGARKLFKEYPYASLYNLDEARQIRERARGALVYVGGADSAESLSTLMAEGFDFVQLGRALLSDPDLPLQIQAEPGFKSRCVHCNECIATIDLPAGVHCPRFDPQTKTSQTSI